MPPFTYDFIIAGEPTEKSLKRLFELLTIEDAMGSCKMNSSSHFVDLGAGFGKPVFGAGTATGIEAFESRFTISQQALQQFSSEIPKTTRIQFLNRNLLQPDPSLYHDFTHVYIFDSAFDPKTFHAIAKNLVGGSMNVLVSGESAKHWADWGLSDLTCTHSISLDLCFKGRSRRLNVFTRVASKSASVTSTGEFEFTEQ